MMVDVSSITGLFDAIFTGITGGNLLIMAILFIAIIGVVLIYAKARASLVLVVSAILVFIFGMLVPSMAFIFWIILLASGFMLIMGLRRWLTSQ
jgi:hypothetical protein